MTVYNVIVTYNRAELLRKTLGQLRDRNFGHVIVVNNASTDNTAAVLDEFLGVFDEFHVRSQPTNEGGAGGFAVGMSHFLMVAKDGDYALLHDDDSWPNFPAHALDEKCGPHLPLGTFPVIHPNGDLVAMNRPGNARFLRNLLYAHEYLLSSRRPLVLSDFDNRSEFEYCSFVGFLVRRDVVSRLGVPSKEFFIYSDDVVYTYLAFRQFGPIKNLYNGGLTFTHDCNRATGKSLLMSRFAFYDVRNKLILFRLLSRFSLLFSVFFVLRSLALAPGKVALILKATIASYKVPAARFMPVIAENEARKAKTP